MITNEKIGEMLFYFLSLESELTTPVVIVAMLLFCLSRIKWVVKFKSSRIHFFMKSK